MFDGAKHLAPIWFGVAGVIVVVLLVMGGSFALVVGVPLTFVAIQALRFFNRLERRDRVDAVKKLQDRKGKHGPSQPPRRPAGHRPGGGRRR